MACRHHSYPTMLPVRAAQRSLGRLTLSVPNNEPVCLSISVSVRPSRRPYVYMLDGLYDEARPSSVKSRMKDFPLYHPGLSMELCTAFNVVCFELRIRPRPVHVARRRFQRNMTPVTLSVVLFTYDVTPLAISDSTLGHRLQNSKHDYYLVQGIS